jgi:hypothetical protein
MNELFAGAAAGAVIARYLIKGLPLSRQFLGLLALSPSSREGAGTSVSASGSSASSCCSNAR